jgi:hypothetical protein
MAERNRRKIVVVCSGTASVMLGAAAVVGLSMAGTGRTPTAEAAGAKVRAQSHATGHPTGRPTAAPMADGTQTPITDGSDVGPQAISFIKEKDPGEKVARHVKKVVQSGSFLRVYTDLPEGDENSKSAISLCEWTTQYLADLRGDKDPIVFIHAKASGNGSVVLANKQSAKDNCTVGGTR